jgi:NAD(P)-dependent dehydrogenase (short-subunit alcohol dehydrogenase family)
MDFENKVIIVTGASSGIGQSCCEQLLKMKSKVIGFDINKSNINDTQYKHYIVDITNEDQIKKYISEITNSFGQINGLVNAAGIFTNNKPFYELDTDLWNKVISINMTGTFIVSKYVSKEMIKIKSGKIVNISCIRSSIFKSNMAEYAASKGGIVSLTSVMSLDLAPYNIQVNAVAPGFIYTGMTAKSFDQPIIRKQSEELIPNGRIGIPEDISSVILFLLSEMSNYVTGTTIFADGGYRLQK